MATTFMPLIWNIWNVGIMVKSVSGSRVWGQKKPGECNIEIVELRELPSPIILSEA